MSNRPNHRESEQEVLNEARNQSYGALDVIPQVEVSAGVTAPIGYQAPLPIKINDQLGNPLDATYGAIYGLKVHVVGDGDKYVRGLQGLSSAVSDGLQTIPGIYVTGGTIPTLTDGQIYMPRLTSAAILMTAEQNPIPAGTNLIGGIAASAETGTVYQGTTAKTPKRSFMNIAASTVDGVTWSGDAIGAQGAGVKIRVLAMAAVAGITATNLTFNTKPAGAGTAISPTYANAANGGEVLPFNPLGWFETSANENLSVTSGAGSTTGLSGSLDSSNLKPMPTSDNKDLQTWFNEPIGTLSKINSKFEFLREFWATFTPEQQEMIRRQMIEEMDAAMTELNQVREEIINFK